MLKFDSNREARKYAHRNLHTYDYEIVDIKGVRTLLCDTSVPVEVCFRDPIEDIMYEFFAKLGVVHTRSEFYSNTELYDLALDAGARVCETLEDVVNEYADKTKCKIVTNYAEY